ncbi:Spy/CpxP family protein refolding chaperone [Burkholderiaceae bacterium FT117]|uniref:Spy/CpxP family protein refolding chaperone n=1 Tax=Zeimonas sediminis TaxID=2944268 RepID=UPI0023430FAC|nr:Spy/CpxP family protein refolding chaperone [Zeimonas sediminis]MCM5569837.1 Spy/CpxP family protein refolding chaperone [Zeimonas sediminis]
MKRLFLASALALAAGIAAAQPAPDAQAPGMMGGYGPGYGMGPGMMGGYGPGYGMGPGMMGGYGPGYGMGPGARGGYGPGYHMGPGGRGGWGPGMMGGYGPGWGMGPGMMGPGMMGGWGAGMMGPGMMGGWGSGMMGGAGFGMMGLGAGRALWLPDLNDKQRAELSKIQDETRRKQWEIAGKMQDEMAKIRDAMDASGKRDRAEVMAAFDRMTALRKQRLEIALDTAERVDQVLTPEQREKLRRWGPWWGPDGEGRQ